MSGNKILLPERIQTEFYKQGSDACRNYSQLTQRVRTFALVATVAAASAPLLAALKIGDIEGIGELLGLTGFLMCVLAISLALVDWHYQMAFEGIRNLLAGVEARLGEFGPWTAHFNSRNPKNDFIASYLPFTFLFMIGTLAIVIDFMLRWSIHLPERFIIFIWIVVIVLIIGGEAAVWMIVYRMKAEKKHEIIEKLLTDIRCLNSSPEQLGRKDRDQFSQLAGVDPIAKKIKSPSTENTCPQNEPEGSVL